MADYIPEEKTEASSFEEILKNAKNLISDKKIADKLSKEKIMEQINKFSEKAKKIIDNSEKVVSVLDKAQSLCDDLSHIRIVGKYFKDISLTCSMINDYICKRYTRVPMATVITLLAAVLYFISPIDLIPDFIPLIGHLDDMIVFAFVQDAAKVDLKKYEKWKNEKEKEEEEKEKEKSDLISEG